MGALTKLFEERKALDVLHLAASARGDRRLSNAADADMDRVEELIANTPATSLREARAIVGKALEVFDCGDSFCDDAIEANRERARRLLWCLKRGAVYRSYVDQLVEIASLMESYKPDWNMTRLLVNIIDFYSTRLESQRDRP